MTIKILGWFSIIITTLALAPSIVPGAMSILAFYLSLGALIVSILTIKSADVFYFKTTAIIVCVGMLVVNDYLRFYGSLSQATWAEKIGLYAFYIVICITGFFKAKKYCK